MKKYNIKNGTALVTGAASGLGFEFSMLLAQDSCNLILVDIDKDKIQDAKKHIQKRHNIQIKIIVKDLSAINAAQEIFASIRNTPIDILINNAGFGLFGPFYKTNWQREYAMLNLHIYTTTQLTKYILNGMVKRRYGKILNISSMAAFQPGPLMSIYYASKAYILSFSQAIANELKGTGITVTALCPGQTKTSFQEVVSGSHSINKIKFSTASAIDVAKYGYEAMLKGKAVAIPGAFNRFLAIISRLVPRNIATSIVRKMQEINREKQFSYNNSLNQLS